MMISEEKDQFVQKNIDAQHSPTRDNTKPNTLRNRRILLKVYYQHIHYFP